MAEKKYKVFLTRTYEVTLIVDEVLTPDDDWRETFYDLETLEEMAGHIAYNIAMFGRNAFVEGIGRESDGHLFKIIKVDNDWEEPEVEEIK